jgi:hypothetical protein
MVLLQIFCAAAYAAEGVDISVSSRLEFDGMIRIASCSLAIFLFLFTASAYERSGKQALAYMSVAFLLFALKGLILSVDLFRSMLAAQLADVLDLVGLLFLFVAVLKK